MIIATQVDAGARAIGLTGRAAARKSRLITEAATALFIIATAVAIRLTCGLGKNAADATQPEDAAKGCGRDGFEGLTT